MNRLRSLIRAAAASRWAPVRKIAVAAIAGLVGWGGWAIWLAGNGDLDLPAALRAAGLAALPVLAGYFVRPGQRVDDPHDLPDRPG